MSKIVLLQAIIFFSLLQVSAQTCNLSGYIKGLGNRPVVFGYEQQGQYRLDTVFASNDRFTYQPHPSDDGKISIQINRPRYTSFWYEPGNLTVTGSIEKPYKLTLKGGPDNNILSQSEQAIDWFYDDKMEGQPDSVTMLLNEQKRQAILQFIRQHPAARTSAFRLYWETMVNDTLISTYQQLLKNLTPAVQASFYGKQTARRIKILENQPLVGRIAPAFALPDTAGKSVSLTQFKGKYVLLDFWGHWCSPCLKALPKIKGLHEKYTSKLIIIGIAAEFADDKPQWLRTIKTNKLNWIQVSELKADKGEVNGQYNITAFPTYLLLDKNGVVVARALGIDEIEQKLASLGDL